MLIPERCGKAKRAREARHAFKPARSFPLLLSFRCKVRQNRLVSPLQRGQRSSCMAQRVRVDAHGCFQAEVSNSGPRPKFGTQCSYIYPHTRHICSILLQIPACFAGASPAVTWFCLAAKCGPQTAFSRRDKERMSTSQGEFFFPSTIVRL